MRFKTGLNYDRLGIITSLACAIHCTLLPLLVSILPFCGMDFFEQKGIEWTMMGMALIFGALSLYHGYKHHRKILPVVLFGLGFTSLVANQLLLERYVMLLIPASATLIIISHTINLYHLKKKDGKTCHPASN